MKNNAKTPRSVVNGLFWPGIPSSAGAAMLAVQYQLEQSQWWAAEQLIEQQFRQLQALLTHACKTVPFYRERLLAAGFNPGNAITPELFRKLPILHRKDIQTAGNYVAERTVTPPVTARHTREKLPGRQGGLFSIPARRSRSSGGGP